MFIAFLEQSKSFRHTCLAGLIEANNNTVTIIAIPPAPFKVSLNITLQLFVPTTDNWDQDKEFENSKN